MFDFIDIRAGYDKHSGFKIIELRKEK